MRVYAHRGASIEYPENTLTAFQRALELGAYGIELDVHLSRDGTPVVIHDQTLDRTTNGSGAVADVSYEELSRLDAGGGERVPSLAAVLELVGDRMHVDIEVKATGAADAVHKLVSARPDVRFAISSFHWDILHYLRDLDPLVELWPLTNSATDEALGVAAALTSPVIALSDGALDEDVARHVEGYGLRSWVWTVNDPDRAAQLATWPVAGICTDDPAAILKRFGSGDAVPVS